MTTADDAPAEEALRALINGAKLQLNEVPLDLTRLAETLRLLLKTHDGAVDALLITGILAAVLENWPAWRYAADGLGQTGDPALGYIAYLKLVHLRPERDTETAHTELLEWSAKSGSIPARMLLLTKRQLRNPVLRTLTSPFVFVYYYSITIRMWLKDNTDPRLPLSYRRGR